MLHKSIEPPPVSNLGDTVPESTMADVGKQLAAEVAIGAKPQTPAHDGRAKPADEATAQMADISFEDLQVDAATESAAHAAATEYANAGFDVYPVWQQDGVTHEAKAPATAHGYKDATRDQAAIDEWWPHCTNLGVALRTGLVTAGIHAGKNLIVIDVDAAKVEGGPDGLKSIDDWCSGRIDGTPHTLPSTLEATTPSGGRHLFFVSDKSRGCVVNGGLRIDVRGTGGGIIVAPTCIAKADGSTGEYQWAGGKFDPSLITEADDEVESLLDLVFARKGGEHVAQDMPIPEGWQPYSAPRFVACGWRHDAIVRYAAHLQAKGYGDEEIAGLVHDFNEEVCEEPIGEVELWQIITWALSKPKGHGQRDCPAEDELVDGPSEEELGMDRYVNKVVKRFGVFTYDEKKEVTVYHQDKLVEAFLYGMHACTMDGAPAIWDGVRYRFGPAWIRYFVELARKGASSETNNSVVKKILAQLEVARRFGLPAPGLICFENCVFDCATGEVRPHDEHSWRERVPNPIPHPLDLSAPPVDYVDAFVDVLADGHEDVRTNLLQVLFTCLSRYTHHEQAAVLIGDGGNGKSKFTDVATELVGIENVSFLGLDRMDNRFEVGDMAGKTANFCSDISSEYLTSDKASTWKKTVGNDYIKADVKNLSGFTFRPFCQVVIVGNSFPRVEGGVDKATERRLFVIPFTHSFRTSTGDYSKDADPNIVEKMKRPEAMAYLIRLVIEEGQRMLAQDKFRFTPNYASEAELRKITLDNSSVLAWMDYVGLTEGDLHMQRRQTVYDHYCAWCRRSQLKAVAINRFNDEVTTRRKGISCVTTRANRYVADASGVMAKERTVQYGAYVIDEQYEAERASHVTYCEVVSTRQTMTSVSVSNSGDRRENHKVEEVSLGVRPATALPAPDRYGDLKVPDAWWVELARFED